MDGVVEVVVSLRVEASLIEVSGFIMFYYYIIITLKVGDNNYSNVN